MFFDLTSRGTWLNSKEECDAFFTSTTFQIAPFIATYKATYLPEQYVQGIKWLNINAKQWTVICWNNSTKIYIGTINMDLSNSVWRNI